MHWIGTSGYNYPEWKGTFYPQELAASKMLAYYADRFTTVEVNYTFYRMPTTKVVEAWAATVPERFQFTLKAPKRLTHIAKLRDCEPALTSFLDVAAVLGRKLGVVLFQLAPTHKKDLATLEAFVRSIPPHARAAFEFRHPSWFDADVLGVLRSRNLALCIADSEKMSTPVRITADYAYFRLRDEGYTPDDVGRWADSIAREAAGCRDVFVYFKHEEEGKGPEFAKLLIANLSGPTQALAPTTIST
jgi:uncharacterized protein YecE (DUF72 family)